ncbi:putative pterin-binding protein [Pseudooceanicola sp. 502str34]
MLGAIASTGIASSAAMVSANQASILTVSDPYGHQQVLTDTDLIALEWREITTHTVWTEGKRVFRGPLLRDVLTLTGLSPDRLRDTRLEMLALNDFNIDMPARDAWDYDIILARTMDGTPMRVRDKGPLWLIYPRDDRRELQSALYDERWIWQLCEILITE